MQHKLITNNYFEYFLIKKIELWLNLPVGPKLSIGNVKKYSWLRCFWEVRLETTVWITTRNFQFSFVWSYTFTSTVCRWTLLWSMDAKLIGQKPTSRSPNICPVSISLLKHYWAIFFYFIHKLSYQRAKLSAGRDTKHDQVFLFFFPKLHFKADSIFPRDVYDWMTHVLRTCCNNREEWILMPSI